MAEGDFWILVWVGIGFIILGLLGLFWGRHEENEYFDHIANRNQDMREYLEHWPPRPQPGALKVGGWIAGVIGLLILLAALAFRFIPGL